MTDYELQQVPLALLISGPEVASGRHIVPINQQEIKAEHIVLINQQEIKESEDYVS